MDIDPRDVKQDEQGPYVMVGEEKQRIIFVSERAQDKIYQHLQLRECAKAVIEKIEELWGRLKQLEWTSRTKNTTYLQHRLPLILNEFKQLDLELEQYRDT